MWRQYGVSLEIAGGFTACRMPPTPVDSPVAQATDLRQSGVDSKRGPPLYTRHTACRRLGAMACLRSSSLIFGDQASDLTSRKPIGFDRSWVPTRGWGSAWSPGCLTGESEERETWTAESLRTASRRRRNPSNGAVGRDFGGTRFRSTPMVATDQKSGVISGGTSSSKRAISRFKVLIQLESLILAQSERWRQA